MSLNRFGVPALAALALALPLALSLGGCQRPVTLWGNLVVGPDMDTTGPFAAHHVVLSSDSGDSDDKDASGTSMRIDIRHGVTDDAVLTGVLEGTKPYNAGVTWHAFTPIIAEPNAARMDYWLFGLNLTRTPDRSVYGIIRFPHAADLAAGGAVDYVLLSCDDLAFARQTTFETDAHTKIALDAAAPPQAGDCEFNSLQEAYAVTSHALKNYDRVHHEKDAPTLNWRPVKVAITP